MKFGRDATRYAAARAARKLGVDYPTARWVSLLLVPFSRRTQRRTRKRTR